MTAIPDSGNTKPGTLIEQLVQHILAVAGLPGMRMARASVPQKPLQALVFSGWGHKPDALNGIIPRDIGEVIDFDYHAMRDGDEVMARLREQHPQPDVVIGWSLGGMQAVRAVAEGVLRPKLLMLLATPQRSIEGLDEKFRPSPDNFRNGFLDMMLAGESQQEIRDQLRGQMDANHDQDWLRWLGKPYFDCNTLDFSRMPPTLLIYGASDAVVKMEDAEFFRSHISNSRLEVLPDCGHASHLHAPHAISRMISEQLQNIELSMPAGTAAGVAA